MAEEVGGYFKGKRWKKGSEAKDHLGHIFRQQGCYSSANIPTPKFEVFGDRETIEKQPAGIRNRSDGTYYYEYLCYAHTPKRSRRYG